MSVRAVGIVGAGVVAALLLVAGLAANVERSKRAVRDAPAHPPDSNEPVAAYNTGDGRCAVYRVVDEGRTVYVAVSVGDIVRCTAEAAP